MFWIASKTGDAIKTRSEKNYFGEKYIIRSKQSFAPSIQPNQLRNLFVLLTEDPPAILFKR